MGAYCGIELDMSPIMPPDSKGSAWMAVDTEGKNPVKTGYYGLSWILMDSDLVEAAGVEPASANSLPSILHA